MTSLNVASNTGLTFIELEGCASLTSLTTTGLTSLTSISAVVASLNTVDVMTNTALQSLNIRGNNIAVLDLSNNGNLVILDAKSNALTDLDMRNGNNANVAAFNTEFNNGLTCIFVDDTMEPNLATWLIDGNSTFVADQAECNTLTVEDVNQNVFNMYPNPVMNTVFVNVNAQDSQISIYDITGKVVLTKSLNLGENTIDVSQMASGVYLARFAAEGNVQTKKLVVQ